MSEISTQIVERQLKALLRESIQGPKKEWSYFTDPSPDVGVLGTIEQLSSTEASQLSGPHDNSVAAHVWHLCFSLAVTNSRLQGDRSSQKWEESWKVQSVNEEEWDQIRLQLKQKYQELLQLIETVELSKEETFVGVMASIAHVAYHLGAIRQKVKRIDQKS